MTPELEQLIQRARGGGTYEFDDLVQRLRQEVENNLPLLLEFLRSPEALVRRAALRVARWRTEPEVIQAAGTIVNDADSFVRETLALVLQEVPDWPLDEVLTQLLRDPDNYVRQAAIRANQLRPGRVGVLLQLLNEDNDPAVRYTIAQNLTTAQPQLALPALLRCLAGEMDRNVREVAAGTVENLLVRSRGQFEIELEQELLGRCRRQLAQIRQLNPNAGFPSLQAWLDRQLHDYTDVEELATYGAVWTEELPELPRAHGVNEIVEATLKMLSGPAPRAVVLLGESGCGKTAVVQELAHRLHDQPESWHLLRVSPSEFLAGTRWLGEWESKLRDLVQAIKAPRRVVLYIPNLQELATLGASSSSTNNIAINLAPHIERGEITILGESSHEAFRKFGANPSLRRLFQTIDVPAATPALTRDIVLQVARDAQVELPEPMLERLLDLSDFHGASAVQPGKTVGLLRRVLTARAARSGPITEREILTTLSTATGMPLNILDDQHPLDRNQIRAFFETRIMGQVEAVEAVVDLVTLVKAGLTDPGKPLGVFLFVGPTGVGKTELARALAELLFGDPARLVRFDMSEFATYEAFERLIGQGYGGAGITGHGLLTAAVRERPFAVLLFDEIEKAHPNIYNLCLQIFDAGRLTDAQGRTADFRKTIIILTSNVGAGQQRMGGFGQPTSTSAERDTMLRELGRWFRPEFLNRLDRIVTFQPLSDQTAESIARREVEKALQRSGITRRRLVVDVDPSVLQLLLREGYSPAFGARPLKRVVERRMLLPLAQAIASGQAPPGSTVRLEARQERIHCQVAPPEDEESTIGPLPGMERPPSVARRTEQLAAELRRIQEQAAPLAARKSELLEQSSAPGFWDNQVAARSTLDQLHRLDAVLGHLADLDKRLRLELEDADGDPTRREERLDLIESELHHAGFLVTCQEPQQLGDAYLTLRLVNSQGPGLEGVLLLARMYQGLAERRGLEVEVLDDRRGGDPPEDTITLVISGAGAHALLAGETGLHQLARGRREIVGGRRRYAEREVIRVEVLPVPDSDGGFRPDELRVETRTHTGTGRLVEQLRHDIRLFHVPTMTGIRAWIDGARNEAVEQLKPLLRARLDAASRARAEASTRQPLVRRYTLGPTTLVRDLRSGKSTGRLDQVLEGRLEMFLLPAGGV